MLPQFAALQGGDPAGERESAEGFRRHRKVRAGCRHSRGETDREVRVTRSVRTRGRVVLKEVSGFLVVKFFLGM